MSTFESLRAIYPSILVQDGHPDEETGWLTFDEFWESKFIDRFLKRMSKLYKTDNKNFLAASLLNQYSWLFLSAGIGSFYLDQRMPSLSPQNLRWHFSEEGNHDKLAVIDPAFSDLSPKEMRAKLQADLENHMDTAISILKEKGGPGKKAMWGMMGDRIGSLIVESTKITGETEGCGKEIRQWMDGSSMYGKTDVIWVEHNGQNHPFMQRGVCCLTRKLPGANYCATCPLLKPKEQKKRLRDELARQA